MARRLKPHRYRTVAAGERYFASCCAVKPVCRPGKVAGHPTQQQKSLRRQKVIVRPRCVADLNVIDRLREAALSGRALSQQLPPYAQPRPIQIADRAVRSLPAKVSDARKSVCRMPKAGGIDDEAVGRFDQLLEDVAPPRQRSGPPDVYR